jgi:hypothetical protein
MCVKLNLKIKYYHHYMETALIKLYITVIL